MPGPLFTPALSGDMTYLGAFVTFFVCIWLCAGVSGASDGEGGERVKGVGAGGGRALRLKVSFGVGKDTGGGGGDGGGYMSGEVAKGESARGVCKGRGGGVLAVGGGVRRK